MSSTTKIFTETIAPSPECFTYTETLLKNCFATDDKPNMIRSMFSFEIFTIFRCSRDKVCILLLEDFWNISIPLTLHIRSNERLDHIFEFVIIYFIFSLSSCEGTLFDNRGR